MKIAIIFFQVMTFTNKNEYERWFNIASGLLVWMNLYTIAFIIWKSLI